MIDYSEIIKALQDISSLVELPRFGNFIGLLINQMPIWVTLGITLTFLFGIVHFCFKYIVEVIL